MGVKFTTDPPVVFSRQAVDPGVSSIFSLPAEASWFKVCSQTQDASAAGPGFLSTYWFDRMQSVVGRVDNGPLTSFPIGAVIRAKPGEHFHKVEIYNQLAFVAEVIIASGNSESDVPELMGMNNVTGAQLRNQMSADNWGKRTILDASPRQRILSGTINAAATTIILGVAGSAIRAQFRILSISLGQTAGAAIQVAARVWDGGAMAPFFNGRIGADTCKHVTYPTPVLAFPGGGAAGAIDIVTTGAGIGTLSYAFVVWGEE